MFTRVQRRKARKLVRARNVDGDWLRDRRSRGFGAALWRLRVRLGRGVCWGEIETRHSALEVLTGAAAAVVAVHWSGGIHGHRGSARGDVTSRLGCFARVAILLLGLLVPVFVILRVFDVLFEIGYGSAVGTQEVWPGGTIEDRADTLVVPDVRAWGDE